ncbi:hypothetical protein HK098_005913 [Nowakowskiella sp. JEL0407]|nr:hypothetical protein HK098_005913 [Nowakowskiella sp. JEL0407]
MHNSKDSKIFLLVNSDPIIEGCDRLRIGDYTVSAKLFNRNLSDLIKAANLSTETNLFRNIQDFNWLRAEQSPHWSLINDSSMVTVDSILSEAKFAEDSDFKDWIRKCLELFRQIDIPKVRCLNESVPDSAKSVFKTWDNRFDTTLYLESDVDEELIIFIPFTASLKVKSIAVRGGSDGQSPNLMKAFVNREDVDFDTVGSMTPDQEWSMVSAQNTIKEIPEYPTRIAKFTALRNLTLYFPSNFGADTSVILYIGLKGEHTEFTRDPIINTVYELSPNPAKLKNVGTESVSNAIL